MCTEKGSNVVALISIKQLATGTKYFSKRWVLHMIVSNVLQLFESASTLLDWCLVCYRLAFNVEAELFLLRSNFLVAPYICASDGGKGRLAYASSPPHIPQRRERRMMRGSPFGFYCTFRLRHQYNARGFEPIGPQGQSPYCFNFA